MKPSPRREFAVPLCIVIGLWVFSVMAAPLGTIFTYQGHFNESGVAYRGAAEFKPTLWDSASGGSQVGENNPALVVVSMTNGLFVLSLDFGEAAFREGQERWLQLEVRTGLTEFTTLTPRQRLAPVPYALTCASLAGTLPSANLGGTYSNAVTFNNTGNSFAGSGAGLSGLNANNLATGTVPDARLSANVARASQVWLLGGNTGTTPGNQFLGTTDNQPLELKVNGQRVLRLEDNGDSFDPDGLPDGAPNLICGSPGNYVGPGVVGAVIGGGGATNHWGWVGTNTVLGVFGVVAGGVGNHIRDNAWQATISGGGYNTIGSNSPCSVIGGGAMNSIPAQSHYSIISGGFGNMVGFSDNGNEVGTIYGVIGGGEDNTTAGDNSVIGGGSINMIAFGATAATVGGGKFNRIGTNAECTAIGGGFGNTARADARYATIAGGFENNIGTNADYIVISGGHSNSVGVSADCAVIAGGSLNYIDDSAGYGAIGGGALNIIAAGSEGVAIGGGWINYVRTNSHYATIGGGFQNTIDQSCNYGAIAGGNLNYVGTFSEGASIAGGYHNDISASSSYAVIAGGTANQIGIYSGYSIVGGGNANRILDGSSSALIAGGEVNVIGTNADYSTIGGGYNNNITANAPYATIPGGTLNSATNYAFAAGRRAKARHQGAFVWGDSYNADIASTNANSLTMRAGGGYRLFSNNGATAGAYLAAGSGSWTSMSDRNAKANLEPVNTRAVLERVASVPVSTWNYRSQDASVRHIGPMAQDFKAAFDVGESDTGISTIDADGVALAAIQGLNQKVEDSGRSRDTRIMELERTVAELKTMVNLLTEKLQGDAGVTTR